MRRLAFLWLSLLFAEPAAAQLSRWAAEADRFNEDGRYVEAQAAAERALRLNPKDEIAMLELAVARASQAMDVDPYSGEAYAVRGAAYWELNLNDLAIKDLQQAALRDARFMPMLRAIGGDQAVPNGVRLAHIGFAALRGNPFVVGGMSLNLLALIGFLIVSLVWLGRRMRAAAAKPATVARPETT